MKDKRDKDFLIKSMLENGQEEVPGHIWDSISSRLDAVSPAQAPVEPAKVLFPWWRYVVAGLSVAAAITLVAIFGISYPQDGIEPSGEGIIAVVEDTTSTDVLIAKVDEKEIEADFETRTMKTYKPISEAQVVAGEGAEKFEAEEQSSGEQDVSDKRTEKKEEATQTDKKEEAVKIQVLTETNEQGESQDLDAFFSDDFEVEGAKPKKNRVAISMSGQTGGHMALSKGGPYSAPMRSPLYQIMSRTAIVEHANNNSVYGLPLSAGLGMRIGLTKRWALGTGVTYSLLTRKYNGTYNNVEEGITIASDIKNSQHYIGIPLNVYFSILSNKRLDFYASAGGAVEKCVKNHYIILEDRTYTHTTNVKGAQWSISLGLGVEYKFTNWFGLYIDPSLRYYFDTAQPKSNRTVQPLNLGAELGLRFHL